LTIIATYRREDITIYIYDSMLTVKEFNKQIDASFKFIPYDEKVGLFLSGDVNLWKKVMDGIKENISEVNAENIMEFDGPFRWEINKIVGASTKGMYDYSRALGFIRDPENKKNLQFLLELKPGKGCLIREIENGELKVIGSGSYVPDIELILKDKFDILYNNFKNHLDYHYFASECRIEMERLIQACGPSVYKILGISTVLSIAYLAGDYFKVIGEERQGGYFTKVRGHRHKFATLKNKNGQIQYLDHFDRNKGYYLNNVFDTSLETSGDIFDPRYSLNSEDPLKYYSESNKVYWLDQWVEEDEQFLWRTIERVEFREYMIKGKKVIMPHPKRKRIASQINERVGIYNILKYKNIDEMYFSISIEQSQSFEKELPINMYNHNWLSRYIPEYNRLYIVHSFWTKCNLIFGVFWSKLKKNKYKNKRP